MARFGGVEEYLRRLYGGEERGVVPSIVLGALGGGGALYGLAAATRNLLFDRGILPAYRAACPVISVGNLVAGGTGKTPLVEWLALRIQARSIPLALVSRGYGGVDAQGGAGDEVLVLHENLPGIPHLQGARRAPLARAAVAEHRARIVVLDDGFQHRWLARDLDLVLLDATHPRGFYHLLPRGLLRESFRGLRRAGCVVLTRTDLADPAHLEWLRDRVRRTAPAAAVAESRHRPTGAVRRDTGERLSTRGLRGMRVLLVSGIGNPGAFERTARDLGVEVLGTRRFPDHHPYGADEVRGLEGEARRLGARAVLTTQKDIVKIGPWIGTRLPFLHLAIEVEFTRGLELVESLLEPLLAPLAPGAGPPVPVGGGGGNPPPPVG